MQVLSAGAIYFALAFGSGFMLGAIRVLWVVPAVGERLAELIETPIMLVVIVLSARWVARRFALASRPTTRLGVGGVALGFLLAAELTMVLWLRGLTASEYVASRDPLAGTVYLMMLGVFAIMPLLVARR
jgi:hypothetical protein